MALPTGPQSVRRIICALAVLLPTLALGAGVGAQDPRPVVMRVVQRSVSTDSGAVGTISQLRTLEGGRLLVNDGIRHRLVLFDSALKVARIVADNEPLSAARYGSQVGRLIP